MNWDILEGYVETLLEMIAVGDCTSWEAKKKFKAAIKDFKEHYAIIPTKNSKNSKPSIDTGDIG